MSLLVLKPNNPSDEFQPLDGTCSSVLLYSGTKQMTNNEGKVLQRREPTTQQQTFLINLLLRGVCSHVSDEKAKQTTGCSAKAQNSTRYHRIQQDKVQKGKYEKHIWRLKVSHCHKHLVSVTVSYCFPNYILKYTYSVTEKIS